MFYQSYSNDHNTEVMAQTVYVLNMMVYNGNYLSSEERREGIFNISISS